MGGWGYDDPVFEQPVGGHFFYVDRSNVPVLEARFALVDLPKRVLRDMLQSVDGERIRREKF